MANQQLDVSRTPYRYVSLESNGNNKATLTVEAKFTANSMLEVYKSKLMPMNGSTLPDDTRFVLRSRSLRQLGNRNEDNGKLQFIATLSYETSGTGGGASMGSNDQDPWDLGATNVQLGTAHDQKPLTKSYGADSGKLTEQPTNTAGDILPVDSSRNYQVLRFEYCIKGEDPPGRNFIPFINKSSEKVAGIDIPKHCGKLMPLSGTYIVEYDDDGEEKRKYWRMQAEIYIKNEKECSPSNLVVGGNTSPWAIELLNVGTRARFGNNQMPDTIWRYYEPQDNEINESSKPIYGTAAMAVAAKKKFIDSLPADKKKNPPNFPITEVTEPLPLDKDGKLATGLMEAGNDNRKYLVVAVFDCPTASWSGFDMPSKKEGD